MEVLYYKANLKEDDFYPVNNFVLNIVPVVNKKNGSGIKTLKNVIQILGSPGQEELARNVSLFLVNKLNSKDLKIEYFNKKKYDVFDLAEMIDFFDKD